MTNKRWAPVITTKAFDSYWKLAALRQEIFFKRFQGEEPPWTTDPVLQEYKFTNAYRASDRVSQYLIKNVIYSDNFSLKDLFFRIILFKIFNKIETWELLEDKLGEIKYSNYNFELYDRILSQAKNNKKRIYSAAYIMPSGSSSFGYRRKHQNNLRLIEYMMREELPERISNSRSMQEVFELFRNCPTLGDFLAYQYAIDINYSELTNFDEMSFVIPGPGAKNGLRKCFADFGNLNEVDLIRLMAERQDTEFAKLGIKFKSLWGRPLQLIDCQNLFCEVDKYSRVVHPEIRGVDNRVKIKQKYKRNSLPINLFYPPKWGINEAIEKSKK